MITIKLKIKYSSDYNLLNDYIFKYTGLFYKLYNNPELLSDKIFINSNLNNLIDKSIYDSCSIDVLNKLKQYETSINQKKDKIDSLEKYLNNTEFKTKKELRSKYKTINKLSELKRNLDKNITFGGKNLLRDITRLSQNNSNPELLEKLKFDFKEKRKIGIYLVGRACENGNRKVKFDFTNNKIIFKPNRNNKIEIEYYSSKNQIKTLNKLQGLSDNNLIPLTVRIDSNYIYLNYDESIVSGYDFKLNECKKEQKYAKDKEERKEIYKKYCNELEKRKLVGKIKDRYCSIDLNPNYIGLSIIEEDKENNGEIKIIHKECIDFSKLNIRLGESSDNEKQKKQNNKRKYEITESINYIFRICKHYKVYNFVMEDLNFKSNKINERGKEFNRKTKNIWCRELIVNLIKKNCNIIGMKLIEVNPVYSSFIGNMVYNEFDPIAASLEIGRRGVVKYKKGFSIYPDIFRINQEKLNYLLGENINIEGINWLQLYNKISLLRYRNPRMSGKIDKNLKSKKSRVKIIS